MKAEIKALRLKREGQDLYNFVVSWLEEKGCNFVDYGGFGVTGTFLY